jgi:hypothetical protein
MAPYLFSFIIDPESLILGIGLGIVAGLAIVIIMRNI